MKISLNWLKEYVSIAVSPEKLAEKLTLAGLEAEKIDAGAVWGGTILELEITPNRPDCLSYLGIAREVAALFNRTLKEPKISGLEFPRHKPDIVILDKKGCRRYVGTLLKDVKIAESPDGLKRHLNAIGIRAINNVVDITNFCLLETGQPLHAFDHDRLQGGRIIVRRAEAGESLTTIDGVERSLDSSILVIADEKRPVAIAGIMGGKETEVTLKTKNILLESAYFDPVTIRRAARKLGLTSDSSYRFERGVDIAGVKSAAQRALSLMQDLSGGRIEAYQDLWAGKERIRPKRISVARDEINGRLGTSLSQKQCQRILNQLGCTLQAKKDVFQITAPSFRPDLKAPVDIVEEVARIVGYDRLPSRRICLKASFLKDDPRWDFKKNLVRTLLARGFHEVITFAMIDQKVLGKTNLSSLKGLRIKNPLSQDQEIMRPILFPSLLALMASNMNHGEKNLRFFEIGKEYSPSGERAVVGLGLAGIRTFDWRAAREEVNFYDIKGAVESLFDKDSDLVFSRFDDPVFQRGECAAVKARGESLGLFGRVSDEVLARWDIKHKIYLAQLDLEKMMPLAAQQRSYQPIAEYPAIIRDISLAVKPEISFQKICGIVKRFGAPHLTSIKFLEEYRGDKIPQGHRGLIFSLSFQSAQRTLREEEINVLHDRICRALADELGAIRR